MANLTAGVSPMPNHSWCFYYFINTLLAEGNPGGIKAALNILGLIGNNLRLPCPGKRIYYDVGKALQRLKERLSKPLSVLHLLVSGAENRLNCKQTEVAESGVSVLRGYF